MPDNNWNPTAIATIALAAATIVLAIATGLQPLLQFIRSRRSQPTSNPNQRTAIQRIGDLLRSPWSVLPWLLVDIYLLVREFRDTLKNQQDDRNHDQYVKDIAEPSHATQKT